jgi:hypothetical protein
VPQPDVVATAPDTPLSTEPAAPDGTDSADAPAPHLPSDASGEPDLIPDRPLSADASFDVPVPQDVPLWDETGPARPDAGLDSIVLDLAGGALDTATDIPVDGGWPMHAKDPSGNPLTLALCGDDQMDWSRSQTIKDGQVVGSGACASTTVAEIVDRVLALFQSDAGYKLGGCYPQACGVDNDIKVLRHGDGFRIILVSTNNMAGMHYPIDCNYFETDARCQPVAVGHFWSRQNFWECEGVPLWGYPMPVYCDANWPGCGVDAGP